MQNVLIDANRDYYPIARVREFWEWLQHQGSANRVKVPLDCYEEIKAGNDDLTVCARDEAVETALLLEEEVDPALVSEVINSGYAQDLTDDEVEKLGRDPFLIAHALASPHDRCVVTTERSKPRQQRANRHLPDVCRDFKIPCCDTFALIKTLDFKTNWRSE